MNDEQLERRMRDWNEAEMAAKHAERAALRSLAAEELGDAVETPKQRAIRLRRAADAILGSILEDVRVQRVAEWPRNPQYEAATTAATLVVGRLP